MSSHIFDDASAMLEAAAAGPGVALTPGIAAMPYLPNGALVAARPYRLPGHAFYAELSSGSQLKPAARAAWTAACNGTKSWAVRS